MVFRNLSLFVIMNGGGGGADRLLRFRSHAASSQAPSACSDRALFESPQDFLTDGRAFAGSSPTIRISQSNKKSRPLDDLLNSWLRG